MKPESKTIGQSRTWAHSLCNALERSFEPWERESSVRLFDFWDAVCRKVAYHSLMKVMLRYGRTHRQLARLRQALLEDMQKEIMKKVNY